MVVDFRSGWFVTLTRVRQSFSLHRVSILNRTTQRKAVGLVLEHSNLSREKGTPLVEAKAWLIASDFASSEERDPAVAGVAYIAQASSAHPKTDNFMLERSSFECGTPRG
jgi:hypothetical protein